MLKISITTQFKRDFKAAKKRGCRQELLEDVLGYLVNEKPLPEKYRDHKLSNSRRYKNARECHISPDWLLVYAIDDGALLLKLIRTGTHSDLFGE